MPDWADRSKLGVHMLKIGAVQLDAPVVQAALSGYSDLAMRRMARRHGAAFALNEVVLDKLVLTPGKGRRGIFNVPEDDHPVGGQIMGAEPEQFARAADLMVSGGYDTIDINFGCPVRKVLGRRRGGFLLSRPDTALEMVKRVVEMVAGRVPVSIKMRRGMDDSYESERGFFRILDGTIGLGIAAVTVHGRTVRQRYVGPSDWSFLARVKRHVGELTILGSGDLFCAEDAVRMMRETGVDGVSLARGCIGNPWIFNETRALLAGKPVPPPPSVAEQGRTILEHYELADRLYGDKKTPRVMRKFGIRYARLHPCYVQVRDAFVKASSCEEWHEVIRRWYDPERGWPPVTRRTSRPDLIAAGARTQAADCSATG
ncbi:MAG: tRNA-dihydrouridine synthase [Phycisphaerales bacterium]|nr:MAG: tRNA-dihydrouridine synthase [Phycisphaerales bacterium]